MKHELKQKNRYYTRRFLPNVALIAVLGITGLFVSCRNNHDMNKPTSKTYTVTFSMDEKTSKNGSLTAMLDGKKISSPAPVAEGKTIMFTAKPNTGFTVNAWTITGGSFETGTGKQGDTTAKLIVNAPVTVTVSFKKEESTKQTPPSPPPVKKHRVIFNVDGTNGTLKAMVDGKEISSPVDVEEGKTISFTATPHSGFTVNEWTITGGSFETGTGKQGDTTAKVAVNAPVTVTVSFIKKTHQIRFSTADETDTYGTLTAMVDGEEIMSLQAVEEGKMVTFTANPKLECTIDKWTCLGAGFDGGSGTQGSITAQVIVTAPITVTVSFETKYTRVAYSELDSYLKDKASAYEFNYIELTGPIPPQDFKGTNNKSGTLGEKIKKQPTKPIALKLPETVQDLTDMTACFYGCTNLVSVLNVPQSVTNMTNSFYECESLETAPILPEGIQNLESCFKTCEGLIEGPVIPHSVTNLQVCFEGCTQLHSVTLKCPYNDAKTTIGTAFEKAFENCTALGKDSIKVPNNQLAAYKNGAATMGINPSCFVAE